MTQDVSIVKSPLWDRLGPQPHGLGSRGRDTEDSSPSTDPLMGHTVPCSPRSPSRKPDLLAERRLELQLWSGGRGGTTPHHSPLSCAWDQQMAWSPGPQGGRVSPSTPGPWAVLSVCWFNSSSKLWRPPGASPRGELEEGVYLWPWLQKPLAPWVMISSSPWPLVGTAVSHTWGYLQPLGLDQVGTKQWGETKKQEHQGGIVGQEGTGLWTAPPCSLQRT